MQRSDIFTVLEGDTVDIRGVSSGVSRRGVHTHMYICALRGVNIGRTLSAGHLPPVGAIYGVLGTGAPTASRMTAVLQAHLQAAGQSGHVITHSVWVGGLFNKSQACTVVDIIVKIGGQLTEQVV